MQHVKTQIRKWIQTIKDRLQENLCLQFATREVIDKPASLFKNLEYFLFEKLVWTVDFQNDLSFHWIWNSFDFYHDTVHSSEHIRHHYLFSVVLRCTNGLSKKAKALVRLCENIGWSLFLLAACALRQVRIFGVCCMDRFWYLPVSSSFRHTVSLEILRSSIHFFLNYAFQMP